MYPSETGHVDWSDIRGFAGQLFTFWPDRVDLSWAKLMWRALEKSGLTVYHSDYEEGLVRERIVCLALIYYEFCTRSAWIDSNQFVSWDDDLIHSVCGDISEESEENFISVREALLDYFLPEGLFSETWVNCLIGDSKISLTTKEQFDAYQIIYSKIPASGELPVDAAYSWLVGGGMALDDFECISGCI